MATYISKMLLIQTSRTFRLLFHDFVYSPCRKLSLQCNLMNSEKNVGGILGTDHTQDEKKDSACSSEFHGQKEANKFKNILHEGPSLGDFIKSSSTGVIHQEIDTLSLEHPYVSQSSVLASGKKVYFETYGCQMNVNDTEIAWSILQKHGYTKTENMKLADVVLLMTCAIRESAEEKIWNKLKHFVSLKKVRKRDPTKSPLKIGILGCMAERLKHSLIEKEQMIDLVAGPDSYRHLPFMLADTESGQTAVNVLLSLEETYADVMPVRMNSDSVTAFVSVMRGCDNMCSYCIVPFTRGRERSRPIDTIVQEVKHLADEGVKEVTLLGQNVNSYRDLSTDDSKTREPTHLTPGFRTVYKTKIGGLRFVDLLDKVSAACPELRIRFTSPHPKDFPEEVLHLMKERGNICKQIHLPAQSGSSRVLEGMRRGYTREAYLDLVDQVRTIIPDVHLTSDFICGFCGETEDEFQETLTLVERVKYNFAYMFPYSMREKTRAYHRMVDDVPHEVKLERLSRLISAVRGECERLNKAQIGAHRLVLVEGKSRRSALNLAGRADGGTKVIIPAIDIPAGVDSSQLRPVKPGDYVAVFINDATSQVLKGIPLYHSTLQQSVGARESTVSYRAQLAASH